MNENISASEAVCGFAAWLTCRPEAITIGSAHVYLGYEEEAFLKRANKGNSLFFISPTEKRPKVCGLLMYVVDADSHLGVGV